MQVNSNVVVKRLTPKTRKRQRLWGINFKGKKGKIVKVLINSRGEQQGYRIRFPWVKLPNAEGRTEKREGFEYPFYNSEVSEIEEKVSFPTNGKRKRRTKKQLERDIRVVRRLRRKGMGISELSKRFDVTRQTIYEWVNKKSVK